MNYKIISMKLYLLAIDDKFEQERIVQISISLLFKDINSHPGSKWKMSRV